MEGWPKGWPFFVFGDQMGTDIENFDNPPWDDAKAKALMGSLVLVGLTYLNADGGVDWQGQIFGIVTRVQENSGIDIQCHGETWRGQTMTMPPALNWFNEAKPGTYKLRSTGESLTDPAFIAAWTVTPGQN
jgi:hypothetical protein